MNTSSLDRFFAKSMPAIKWALILFIATLGWMVFEKLMGWHGPKISLHALYSNLYDLLFTGIFLIAFMARRRATLNPTFKALFFFGMTVTALMTLLSPLVQLITHRVISPEFFPNIIELAVNNNLLTPELAKDRFSLSNYIHQNLIGTFLLGLFLTFLFSLIFRKKNPTLISKLS